MTVPSWSFQWYPIAPIPTQGTAYEGRALYVFTVCPVHSFAVFRWSVVEHLKFEDPSTDWEKWEPAASIT
jgi:hypothetical protein